MSQRVVKTQYGPVRGILVVLPPSPLISPGTSSAASLRSVQVEAYIGLEYASLLGSELRFMPPTSPISRWEPVRFAHKFRPVCPQKVPDLAELQRSVTAEKLEYIRRLLPFLETQQEDCLNLNIYAPVTGSVSAVTH